MTTFRAPLHSALLDVSCGGNVPWCFECLSARPFWPRYTFSSTSAVSVMSTCAAFILCSLVSWSAFPLLVHNPLGDVVLGVYYIASPCLFLIFIHLALVTEQLNTSGSSKNVMQVMLTSRAQTRNTCSTVAAIIMCSNQNILIFLLLQSTVLKLNWG